MGKKINVALVGVGNCASSLVQSLEYVKLSSVRGNGPIGVAHPLVGGYRVDDIRIVAAFDIDRRKVGFDLTDAVLAPPNNSVVFQNLSSKSGVTVQMGRILDGYYVPARLPKNSEVIEISDCKEAEADIVVEAMIEQSVDVLVNYLPVGSEDATRFYADCAIRAGVGFVNAIPVFLASDSGWEKKFSDAGLPIVGDDIKAQVGATALHRAICNMVTSRGATILDSYQLNVGGNADFLNMLDERRLHSKRESKTSSVLSSCSGNTKVDQFHIGPSDYVEHLGDEKQCHIEINGQNFCGLPFSISAKLKVEDSPNSAGVVIDAIRACKSALDSGKAGALIGASAYCCKKPPKDFNDTSAAETFISEFC